MIGRQKHSLLTLQHCAGIDSKADPERKINTCTHTYTRVFADRMEIKRRNRGWSVRWNWYKRGMKQRYSQMEWATRGKGDKENRRQTNRPTDRWADSYRAGRVGRKRIHWNGRRKNETGSEDTRGSDRGWNISSPCVAWQFVSFWWLMKFLSRPGIKNLQYRPRMHCDWGVNNCHGVTQRNFRDKRSIKICMLEAHV